MAPRPAVITSYSIHYTKLYEDRLSAEQVEDRLLLRLDEVPQLFVDTLLTVEA